MPAEDRSTELSRPAGPGQPVRTAVLPAPVQPIAAVERVAGVVTVPGDRPEAYLTRATDDGSASFDAYFRQSRQPLVAMAYLLTGDMQTAQDLTQEALLRTWSRWARIGDYDDPQAWTRRVLYNLIVSKARSNKVRRRPAGSPGRCLRRTSRTSCWRPLSDHCPRTR